MELLFTCADIYSGADVYMCLAPPLMMLQAVKSCN